jgi:hypothetical protein
MKNCLFNKYPVSALIVFAVFLVISPSSFAATDKDWHFNGTVIEACSCPMFCQCYFNTYPAFIKPITVQSTSASSTWPIKLTKAITEKPILQV